MRTSRRFAYYKELHDEPWPALSVVGGPDAPYEHLLYVPRYQIRTERLLDKDFRIADGPSFYASYREIFVDEIYKFESSSRRPVIIDCGANYGVSVAYFKMLYPESIITAVEADPRIFDILQWNIKRQGHGDVRLVQGAVYHGAPEIKFYREGADAGRAHNLDGAKEQVVVPTIALDDLIESTVDMLKLDIEGAETDVLLASERLPNVRNLFVEYHSFANAPQSLHLLLEKLATCGFRYYVRTQFCSHRPLTEPQEHLGMDLQLNIFAQRAS